ncbi:MAG TPA: hypothetical protein VMG30_14795 [Acidobacteriota bacterium]|nr:hypothetical protein [Acidobacteriota bacterium]
MSDWAVRVYRLAAKATGIALCRHKIVESAYANRGVGRGEVTFGRSDLDFSVITRTPDPASCDGPELFSFYRWVQTLRCVNPAITHIMVYDSGGIEKWIRTDTYLGSQERRSMLLLAGKPAFLPDVPVRREDAVRWVVFWCDRFFPLAIQERNRRNMRKLAIEVWKAWAVARGIAAEPYLTLREAVQKADSHPVGSALNDVIADPWRSTGFIMKLAGILHDSLFPPLQKLKEPFVVKMLLPPRSRQRVVVVLPHPEAALPAAAFEAQALLVTPELLHLYLHYFDPFLDWNLPSEIRKLGFSAPKPYEFVRACLFFGQDNILRLPGFVRKDTTWLPHAVLAFSRHSVPYLIHDEVPPPMPEKEILDSIARTPDCSEYYCRDYARLCRGFGEQLKVLEQLETPGSRSEPCKT